MNAQTQGLRETAVAIEHIGLSVAKLAESRDFYRAALAPLGLDVVHESLEHRVVGIGANGHGLLWLIERAPATTEAHIAFRAERRESVDAFHRAAIAAGAADNGAPGPRPYGEHYYSAYVLDIERNNVEVVCLEEEG